MAYRLHYLAHDLELPVGEFIVGRSAECQLSVDDPLVSRTHARFAVRSDGVSVSDLGSRNGVLVNGVRIDGPRPLADGDKLVIGSQELTLRYTDDRPRARPRDTRLATQTLGAVSVPAPATADNAMPTRAASAFQLLGSVADKALAMGRAEEAERILQTLLLDVLAKVKGGNLPDSDAIEQAARYAVRLAEATTSGRWVDYVFELYGALSRPIPAPVVDELYTVVRKVKTVDLGTLRAYVAALQQRAASLGPAERFLVQRIEGLVRLCALK
jgi:pSer/pThr/pTyr-binding forkhead associated (FHA) protein